MQKNCSGLIPEALQIHTQLVSGACSLLGGGAPLKKKGKKKKKGETSFSWDAFINGETDSSIEASSFCEAEERRSVGGSRGPGFANAS